MIKNWGQFINESLESDNYIVSHVTVDDYGYIKSIELENGKTITTGEDTGGEDTSLFIEDAEWLGGAANVNVGDEIFFEYEDSDVYNDELVLTGITAININGKKYKAGVASEGGNTETFLIIK
jgi:hypothetical protein